MKINTIKHYCWLAFFVLLIYWPVSTFLFSIKNDALTGYFPAKYFIAESLHNKIIPWWNPYINYGYPMHADFTSSFWSPFTWIYTLLGGYSIYTVQLEFLFYSILAAWGMFRLCISLKQHTNAAFLIALCYACSGIFTGNAQHTNWISAAALLPFVWGAFLTIIHNPSLRSAVKFSLWTALFIVCAHPYLIICLLYLFALLFFFLIKKSTAPIRNILTQLILSLVLILLLVSGYLVSIAELFPLITRGETLNVTQISNYFQPASLLSFLLPFSTVTPDMPFVSSDLSMRNAYMGLTGIFFLAVTFASKKNYYQKIFLLAGLVFFVLSFGGPITYFVNSYVPLIGFIRLIAVFRIPGIFFLLLAGSYAASDFFTGNIKVNPRRIFYVLSIILGLLFIYSLIYCLQRNQYILPESFNQQGLKDWIQKINFAKATLIQSAIQLVFLLIITWKKIITQFRFIVIVCFLDLFLTSSLNAPFTIVGEKSVNEIQQLLNRAPKNFPLPELKPILENETAFPETDKILGNWSMYNKKPGTVSKAKTYPSLFKSNERYFESGLNSQFIHSPFIYGAKKIFFYTDTIKADKIDAFNCYINKRDWLSGLNAGVNNDVAVSLQPTKVLPNEFSIKTVSNDDYLLVLKQNNYKYWNAYIDAKKTHIIPCNYTFMSIQVQRGVHQITFKYEPAPIKWLAIINVSVLCLLLIYSIADRMINLNRLPFHS